MTAAEPLYSWDGPPRVTLWGVREAGSERILHWLEVGDPGAVVVAERAGAVLFVVSRRQAVGAVLLELPRGMGEPEDGGADDPSAAVCTGLRELREETGLVGEDARLIGTYVLDSSVYPARTAVIGCRVLEDPVQEGDGEIATMKWIAVSQISSLISSGSIRDAHSLSALALWRAVNDTSSVRES